MEFSPLSQKFTATTTSAGVYRRVETGVAVLSPIDDLMDRLEP